MSSSPLGTDLNRGPHDYLHSLRRRAPTCHRSSPWPSPQGHDYPYLSHPLAVSALVLEYEGIENQAIAGLLHDASKDGGSAYAPKIAGKFGPDVLGLVEACSDGTAESKAKAITPAAKKADWPQRKDGYLLRLEIEDPAALLHSLRQAAQSARDRR
ncbi:MAG: HD domain-containing protein [Rhodanobacter sp.]